MTIIGSLLFICESKFVYTFNYMSVINTALFLLFGFLTCFRLRLKNLQLKLNH